MRALLDVRYVAMNHSRPLFKDNPGLARAVNWTVDRQAFSAQGGYLYGKRTGQILPPGMLGYKPQGLYPLRVTAGSTKQAKNPAEGNLRGGKAVLWSANSGIAPLPAQLIQYNLRQIGLDAEIRLLPRAQQFTNAGNPQTATFDMTIERWGSDYADPYDFVNVLLDGAQVKNPQHNNYSYFNVAKYNRQMTAASLFTGSKRGSAYAALDGALMRENPPWAPLVDSNDRIFLSSRVGCITVNEAHGSGPLLNVVCLKSIPPGAGRLRPSPPSREPHAMIEYLIRRILWAAVLFVGVTMITYVLFFLLPADPARLAAGNRRRPRTSRASSSSSGSTGRCTSSTCSS